MFAITPDDVCYLAMPLFHSNALMAGWRPALAAGATLALPTAGRFSASGFLPDVRRYGVTYFNYVGKPLSYILATPERPDDADNTSDAGLRQRGGRGRRRPASPSASAARWWTPTARPKAVRRSSAHPTPPAARSGARRRTRWSSTPTTGEECPCARFDDDGRLVNAEEAIGEMVSKSGGGRLRGLLATTTRPSGPGCATAGTGPATSPTATRTGFFYFAGRADDWLRVDGENFAAAPVGRILERHPDVVLAVGLRRTRPRHRRPGDGRPAAAPGGGRSTRTRSPPFSPPRPTWGPSGRRASSASARGLPITATSKVLTRALRAERWRCADPVWWSPDRSSGAAYRRLDSSDVDALERAVAGRSGVTTA